MPVVTFIEPDGAVRRVDAPTGISLMLAAVDADVRGIDADCGGCLSCATCHVYVDPACAHLVPAATEEEDSLLEFVAAARSERSRLSCQVLLTEAMDGLRVTVAPAQA